MKRILTLFLILMLSLFSLLADDNTDTLTVKAYKKKISTTPTFEARVIDALTGSLDVLKNSKDGSLTMVEMDNYVNKFLGTLNDDKNIREKAIFSFHVGGNRIGTYTVQIIFQSLAYYTDGDLLKRDENTYITAQYFLEDMNSYFSSRSQSVTNSSGNKETITTPQASTTTGNKVIVYGTNSGNLEFSWTVKSADTSAKMTETTWDIEAMVAMVLLKDTTTSSSGTEYTGYSDAVNGTYIAPITITMWVE